MTAALRRECLEALRCVVDVDATAHANLASPRLRAAQRHIAICPQCASLVDDADTELILARLAAVRPPPLRKLRIGLGSLAALQVAFAIPWLFGLNPFGQMGFHVATSHLTRDGAIGIIVGVAGLTAAIRPRQALAMLVTAAAAVVMQAFGSTIDENGDLVSLVFELFHVPVPIILALIGVLVFHRPAPIGPPDRPPRLRAVD